jgi:hypothetical protein
VGSRIVVLDPLDNPLDFERDRVIVEDDLALGRLDPE